MICVVSGINIRCLCFQTDSSSLGDDELSRIELMMDLKSELDTQHSNMVIVEGVFAKVSHMDMFRAYAQEKNFKVLYYIMRLH